MSRRALRTLAAAAAVLCIVALASAARAATTLNGEYQLMMELRKNFRAFPWDWDSNDGGTSAPARFWIVTQPAPGVEGFVKVYAQWRRGDNEFDRPDVQFDNAHLKSRREAGPRGFEALLFSRQDRFNVNSYLLPLVYGRGDAQGLRFDTWGYGGTNLTLIAADQSGQLDPVGAANDYRGRYFSNDSYFNSLPGYAIAPMDSLLAQRRLRTDDMYIARLRREFLKHGALRLGMTWNRAETWTGRDSVSAAGRFSSTAGFDSRVHLGSNLPIVKDADIAVEYAQSFPEPYDAPNPQLTFFKQPSPIRLSDRSATVAEVRSLQFGTSRTGYFKVTPQWWMRGSQYANALGGPSTSDETGFRMEGYYLLPERAITYSNSIQWYGTKVQNRNRVREIYNELYVEFVNGFTGKTSYRRRDEFTQRGPFMTRNPHYSWFNELQVESRLAWMRVQSKIQDIGRPEEKQLVVVEERLNLTTRTKIYNRFSLANDPTVLRKAIFTQLQYRPTDNMELFVQYGPDDIGAGANPVDDGNLAGSGDQSDVFKVILKGSF